MRIEHLAINVIDPIKVARWYIDNFEMKVLRQESMWPYTTFLVDSAGNTIIEIYNNPADDVPDYFLQNPLTMHIAFESSEPNFDKNRLIEQGCVLVEEYSNDEVGVFIMLKDPWGLNIQLCNRIERLK